MPGLPELVGKGQEARGLPLRVVEQQHLGHTKKLPLGPNGRRTGSFGVVNEKFLPRVYELDSQEATDAFYSDWAPTYDRELTENGYRSPQRCAEALAQFVAFDAPVLDVGCGTGLSGQAPAATGFRNLSGQDVNAEMVDVARSLGLYQSLSVVDVTEPFPFESGSYAAMAAVGVIGAGAAPVSLLHDALGALAPGSHIVFSFNDHVLEDPEYTGVLQQILESGAASQVFCEYGPHIENLGSGANVYVLQRTLGAD